MAANYLMTMNSTRTTLSLAGLTGLVLLHAVGHTEPVHDIAWDTLPDPTRPYYGSNPLVERGEAAVVQQSSPLQLQSVVSGPQSRYAFVSGKRVEIGDMIDRARVVSIRPYEVVVDVQGELQVLRIVPASPKRERP